MADDAANGEEIASGSDPAHSPPANDARVLVDFRKHCPKLAELDGWKDLTEHTDLRSHRLDGIEVDGEGRVIRIRLAGEGLEGEREGASAECACLLEHFP